MSAFRKIGSLTVSMVGLGCNNFGSRLDQAQTQRVVDAAVDAGINFFDTADIYGGTRSEEYLGRALGTRRSAVSIATKFGLPIDEERKGARPEYVRRAVEDSLRRLGTDYIDLYQIHRPDPEVPIVDTLGVLNELVKAGKVREIGCSNFSVGQLQEALDASAEHAWPRFVSVQNEYSLIVRDAEEAVLPFVRHHGLAFLPYFPLGGGLLTGKYRTGTPAPEGTRLTTSTSRLRNRFLNDGNLAIVDELVLFAQGRGYSALELAFSWLLSNSAVASVIAGASNPEQVTANVAAPCWRLSAEELRLISEIAPTRQS